MLIWDKSSLAGINLDVERGIDHFTSCLRLGFSSDEFCK